MQHLPIAIGKVIRHGVVFDLKNWTDRPMNNDDLELSVLRLFALLAERRVDFTLVGGVALLQYVEGRNTQDIDLILSLSSLERIPEIDVVEQDGDFARGEFEALRVDLLLTRNPLFAHVQSTHTTWQPFAEREIRTATVEGLILLKLYALPSLYRQGNFARVGLYENDIATLLHVYQPDMNAILDELAPFLDKGDMDEIRSLVEELRGRFARFGK